MFAACLVSPNRVYPLFEYLQPLDDLLPLRSGDPAVLVLASDNSSVRDDAASMAAALGFSSLSPNVDLLPPDTATNVVRLCLPRPLFIFVRPL